MKRTAPSNLFAKAYVNVFDSDLSRDVITAFEQAAQYLEEHRRALFFLKVPVIPEKIKKDGLQEVINRFALPSESVHKLFELLLSKKQAGLLAEVFRDIVDVYNRRHDHHIVEISSSSPLIEKDKRAIQQFADKTFSGTKTYQFTVDRSLIAGIQIKSDTEMWESSVENYLRECAQAQIW